MCLVIFAVNMHKEMNSCAVNGRIPVILLKMFRFDGECLFQFPASDLVKHMSHTGQSDLDRLIIISCAGRQSSRVLPHLQGWLY